MATTFMDRLEAWHWVRLGRNFEESIQFKLTGNVNRHHSKQVFGVRILWCAYLLFPGVSLDEAG